MPDTYNPNSTYFMLTIKEKTGQFEHTSEVVAEAFDIVAAKVKAKQIVQTWYEANPHCCGFIFLFKDAVTVEVETIVPITPVEFFERGIMDSR